MEKKMEKNQIFPFNSIILNQMQASYEIVAFQTIWISFFFTRTHPNAVDESSDKDDMSVCYSLFFSLSSLDLTVWTG